MVWNSLKWNGMGRMTCLNMRIISFCDGILYNPSVTRRNKTKKLGGKIRKWIKEK